MKKIVCFILVFLATNSFSQEILLPDQTYTIKVTEKVSGGKVINSDDELIIFANKVSATFSKKDGFPAAVINFDQETKLNSASFTFSAGCTNAKNAALTWSGTINGDHIQGKVQKFFMGTLAGEYIFTGTLKKKK